MGASGNGEVVTVRLMDGDRSVVRPVYVLAGTGEGEFVACQISALPYDDFTAIPLADSDFEEGLLGRNAFIRPRRLMTLSTASVVRTCGRVNSEIARQTASVVTSFLKNSGKGRSEELSGAYAAFDSV